MKNKSFFDNKIVQILLPLIISFGLWLYVITVVSPGSETVITGVPVNIPSEKILWERGLMLASNTEMTVDVKLAGNRSDLNRLDKNDITVEVDLSPIYEAATYERPCEIRVDGNVTDKSAEPGHVKLVVVERQEKKFPITVKTTGRTPDNFVSEKEQLDHANVTVVGPKSLVSTVAEAVVEVDLTDRDETIMQTCVVKLLDRQGQPISGLTVLDEAGENEITEVAVTIPIVMFKEIPIKISMIPGGGATEANTKLVLSYETISVSGPEAILTGLNELDLGSIDLGQMDQSDTFEFEIKLPDGVTNETGVTKVTATVTLPELMTYVFQVTQIRYSNLPEGMEAELAAKVVEVKVRGSSALVSQMTKEDVTVMVDLSEAKLGTEKYTAQIQFSAFYKDVGAMGSYFVTATVTEKD